MSPLVIFLLLLGALLVVALLPAGMSTRKRRKRQSPYREYPDTFSGTDRSIEPSGITPADENSLSGGGGGV